MVHHKLIGGNVASGRVRSWSVVGVGGVLVFGGLTVPPGVQAAATGVPAVVAGPCPPGSVPETPASTTALAGGGFSYGYNVAGNYETHRTPPRGFEPFTATVTELAEYGFPPRPATTDPSYPQWREAMSAYNGDQ